MSSQSRRRFRFHPLVRYLMIVLSFTALVYSVYFILVLIPRYGDVSLFMKATSVLILYVAGNTLYKHLFTLNSVEISSTGLQLGFILRKRIFISWDRLLRMDIYKVITHFWKVVYQDEQGNKREFKTSLAFPGIMEILSAINEFKPDLEMNELLTGVLNYKRTKLSV